MLKQIEVEVLESIVVDELCEFKGRMNVADTNVTVSSLVRTEAVDAIPFIPRRHFVCHKTAGCLR